MPQSDGKKVGAETVGEGCMEEKEGRRSGKIECKREDAMAMTFMNRGRSNMETETQIIDCFAFALRDSNLLVYRYPISATRGSHNIRYVMYWVFHEVVH